MSLGIKATQRTLQLHKRTQRGNDKPRKKVIKKTSYSKKHFEKTLLHNCRVTRLGRGKYKDHVMTNNVALELAEFVRSIDFVSEITSYTPDIIDKMNLAEFLELMNHAEEKASLARKNSRKK